MAIAAGSAHDDCFGLQCGSCRDVHASTVHTFDLLLNRKIRTEPHRRDVARSAEKNQNLENYAFH